MRPSHALALIATVTLFAAPAAALEVCRESPLGVTICSGQPTRGLDPIDPYPRVPRATGRVPEPTGAPRIPEARTNAFGDTFPTPSQTTVGRPKPRVCTPDSFGNLRC